MNPVYDLNLHGDRVRLAIDQIDKPHRAYIVNDIGKRFGSTAAEAVIADLKTYHEAYHP